MGKLKPIGSEKLQGMDKIKRMIEIATYKENIPNPLNETASHEYDIKLADGNRYHIVKEKSGYVIKKGLTESTSDYVEPMKGRKYYSSYSQAFKRLNLIAKEVTDMATRGYDYKDEKNYDNVFGEEFLKGYYTELRDPKNADKHVEELRAIVAKNLAKDISYYVKNGQFGIKGVGYTTEAPGLGTPKEPKGKHKSSGYGELKEGIIKEEFTEDELFDIIAKYVKDPDDIDREMSNYYSKGYQGFSDALKANLSRDMDFQTLVQMKHDEETLRREQGLEEQKLRSLIRNVIQEELNKEDYKTKLRNLERPHIKDKKALEDIIEGDNAAGSYDKIMIGDIIISLARKRKDKIEGTGRFHIMKNRYGADGMTFRAKINTSNGYIEVDEDPVDDDELDSSSGSKPVNDFSNVDVEERQLLQKKFFKLDS